MQRILEDLFLAHVPADADGQDHGRSVSVVAADDEARPTLPPRWSQAVAEHQDELEPIASRMDMINHQLAEGIPVAA